MDLAPSDTRQTAHQSTEPIWGPEMNTRRSSEYGRRVRTRVSVSSEGGAEENERERRVEARTGEEDTLSYKRGAQLELRSRESPSVLSDLR